MSLMFKPDLGKLKATKPTQEGGLAPLFYNRIFYISIADAARKNNVKSGTVRHHLADPLIPDSFTLTGTEIEFEATPYGTEIISSSLHVGWILLNPGKVFRVRFAGYKQFPTDFKTVNEAEDFVTKILKKGHHKHVKCIL